MGLFRHLQANQHLLNEQELIHLNYMMDKENFSLLKNSTLKELADRLYVSPNTIVRMAKKLDYRGYTELKLAIETEHNKSNFLKKGNHLKLIDQMNRTEELLSSNTVKEVLRLILAANHIYFFSCGPSKFPCEEMKEKLRILGFESSLYYEPHVMRQRAKKLKENDLVFVVSLSGETKTPLDAARLVKLTKAKMISITGFSQNSISQLADVTIYTFYDKLTYADMDVSSRLGIYYVLNYIFEELAPLC